MKKIIAILAVAGCLVGCGPTPPAVTDSGLGQATQSKEFLEKNGASVGAMDVIGGSRYSDILNQSQFTVTLKSGVPGQYVASLRDAIKHEIESRGGQTTGSSTFGGTLGTIPDPSSSSIQAFTFIYKLNHNGGLVAVYSVPTTTNEFRLIMLTHEHRE